MMDFKDWTEQSVDINAVDMLVEDRVMNLRIMFNGRYIFKIKDIKEQQVEVTPSIDETNLCII